MDVDCGNELLQVVLRLIKHTVMPVIMIGIPILLIVLGSVDLAKAAISSDDKAVKSAQSAFIRRLIYGALVFFVTMIVRFVMDLVADATGSEDSRSWQACWESA